MWKTQGCREEALRLSSGQAGGSSILNLPAICIGPTTARAADEAGFLEVYFPDEHTTDGIIDELMVIAGALKNKGLGSGV